MGVGNRVTSYDYLGIKMSNLQDQIKQNTKHVK